jgi:hypothetical protein
MKPAFASAIVKYLRVSGSPEADLSCLRASRHRWKQILEWLDQCGLALPFWHRLKEEGNTAAIPREISERLERNHADHQLRVAEMLAEFDLINQCFDGAHLKYAAMKGLALTRDYCPDIFLRTTYDYDYLLARESVEAAENVLRAAGYVRKQDPEAHPIVYFHAARPPRFPTSRDDLYSKAFPRTVELHYLFWDADQLKIPLRLPANPIAQRELRCFRMPPNRQSLSSDGPTHFYALSEDDDLMFQVLHAFRHILHDWCRLSSLLDLAWFLDRRASDFAFWDRFLRHLRPSRELIEILGVVFSLAGGLFGSIMPEPIFTEIIGNLPRPLVMWVERYGQQAALRNFSHNKCSLFLHREFVPNDSTWRAIQRSRLFPIHRPNQAPQGAGLTLASRAAAKWRHGAYVMRRLEHHLAAAARYKLESFRWERALSHLA